MAIIWLNHSSECKIAEKFFWKILSIWYNNLHPSLKIKLLKFKIHSIQQKIQFFYEPQKNNLNFFNNFCWVLECAWKLGDEIVKIIFVWSEILQIEFFPWIGWKYFNFPSDWRKDITPLIGTIKREIANIFDRKKMILNH